MTPDDPSGPFDADSLHADPLHADLVRRRQRSRSIVVAVLLGALVVLIFAITMAKIRAGTM